MVYILTLHLHILFDMILLFNGCVIRQMAPEVRYDDSGQNIFLIPTFHSFQDQIDNYTAPPVSPDVKFRDLPD